jgi:hypothetical protein
MATRKYDDAPGLGSLYARTVRATISRAAYVPDADGLRLELPHVVVDQDQLAKYRDVTGFGAAPTLPVTYPHVLAFPLHLDLMSDPSFPYKPMGIVHLSNTITQHAPIPVHSDLAVAVQGSPERQHPKGTVFDIRSEIRAGDRVVWSGTTTLLSRGTGTPDAHPELLPEPSLDPDASWDLHGNLGRRYAAVSGDRNPIHLYKLSAQAFGFPRQIAHGMWAKAATLASIERTTGLPDAFTVRVEFRKPLTLPSLVRFGQTQAGSDGVLDFALYDESRSVTHLIGRLRPA